MPETQVPKTQFVNCGMHETQVGVEHEVFNIYYGINVCIDIVLPMNKQYEEMHYNEYNANLVVDDYMHNEFYISSHNEAQNEVHIHVDDFIQNEHYVAI